MNINSTKVLSLFSIFFIFSCSQSSMDNEQTSEIDWDGGKVFAEFLACDRGPDFSPESLREMIVAFNQLDISENLMWSGGYAAVNQTEDGPDGYWENNWTSEEAALAAWSEWSTSAEAGAWNEEYKSVMECSTDEIYRYEGHFHAPEESSLQNWESFVAAELACTFNEGKSFVDLKSNIEEFRQWLIKDQSSDEYSFGAYLPTGEDDADFWWYNWSADFDSMERGNANWEENGKAIQAKFDATATCTEPALYNGGQFYIASES
jgi:hypothetical protein